jgi:hypothetical protein
MKYIPGVEPGEAWNELNYDMKARFAADPLDMYDQLSQLQSDS